ncbi:gliding motility-associated ABC transporter permease subunit GldF [Pedobacter sp. Du54]|uniref:gliding motility-associated ABC transporter permease subunit GldF n=1 Tax=Pedobacter anseongensis TaxID=3133439 RepID=UPI0030A0D1AA
MFPVFKRELFSLLNSLMAYSTIGVFLLACALLLWFFPDTSILDYGYAEMNSFFNLVPFLFIFLIPAISMRSFAEERKEGTYVLLATRPLSDWQIILAKYFACVVLVLFALLPTLVYYYSIYQLGMPKGNIDTGAVMGSYIGLFLLGSAFVSVGIFASSLTKNQVVAFSLAVLLCFFAFSGLESTSKLFELNSLGTVLVNLGIAEHYQSISRGVLDTRDLIYFISFVALFLGLTKWVIGGRKW